jgi:hypothetical protein
VKADPLHDNLRHLYGDVAWFGVLAGTAMAFLSVYAARLGADAVHVALLTAGPAALNLIFSLQYGRWLEGRPLARITFRSSVAHRVIYILFVILPWVLPPRLQVWGFVVLVVLGAIPGTLLAIAFNATYGDIVPPESRAHVTGRRNALLAIVLTSSVLASGEILDRIAFPLNFQLVFALGALGAVMSSYHLYHLRLVAKTADGVDRPPRPIGSLVRPGTFRLPDATRLSIGLRFLARSREKPVVRLDLLRGPFGGVLLSFLVFYSIQNLPIPLFPVYWVQGLGLTDAAISIGQAGFNAAMFFGSMVAGPLRQQIGRRKLVLASAALYGAYPLFNGLARDEWLFWAGSIAGGVLWGLLNVGLIDYLFDNVPDNDRPAHMALHNLTLNAGILAGSLIGPVAAASIGLRDMMFVAAGLRLAAAGVFAIIRR